MHVSGYAISPRRGHEFDKYRTYVRVCVLQWGGNEMGRPSTPGDRRTDLDVRAPAPCHPDRYHKLASPLVIQFYAQPPKYAHLRHSFRPHTPTIIKEPAVNKICAFESAGYTRRIRRTTPRQTFRSKKSIPCPQRRRSIGKHVFEYELLKCTCV